LHTVIILNKSNQNLQTGLLTSLNVACTGELRNAFNISVGKPERRDHFEDQGVAGRIILKWMLGK
jgi:hypothetical protein